MKILLVCSGGMSISLLMLRMKAEILKRKINVDVDVVNETLLEYYIDSVDVILLSPQVRYLKKHIEDVVDKNILCLVINETDYGMMNEVKILDNILDIYNNRRK